MSQWQAKTPSLVGLGFAFARATYGTGIDTGYAKHAANFRKAGIVTGAYHFGTFEDGAAQALAFLSVAHDADLLALDLETEAGKPRMTDAQARAFIVAVHRVGRKIGLYHSESGFTFLGQDWDWVAKWGSVPPKRYTFWQWRGAPLDLDRFNGTLAQLRQLAGKGPSPVALTAAQAVSKMRGYVAVYLKVLATKGTLTPHQAESLEIDLKTLDHNLADLEAEMPAAPLPTLVADAPSGLTNWAAAQIDAGWVFQASQGNTVGAENNPCPGAAKALGFSGVMGTSTGTGFAYGIFKGGELIETVTNAPDAGWGFAFGLAGFDNDAEYVKP